MVPRVLRHAYRRYGRRYVPLLIVNSVAMAHVVVGAGVALLLLFQPMSTTEFVVVFVLAQVLVAVENTFEARFILRLAAPADAWLDGDHSPEAASRGWHALAGVPRRYTRAAGFAPLLFTAVPWSIATTAYLGLAWYLALVLIAGSIVTVAYGVGLRYLLLELGMRPPLQEMSRDLPDDFPLGERGLTLRWKMLLGLPVVNLITGVTVAGVAPGYNGLDELGIAVLVTIGVTFTISLELVLLLSRSVVDPIDDLVGAMRRVSAGDLAVRVPVVATDETGTMTQSFNAAVAGLEEREQLRAAFGSYVDPEIAEQILAQGVELEGEEVVVSVLFLDIRGFTAFAEQASARQVVRRLNDFWELVVPILTRHGGHANKFIGDGLLGVFGTPGRLPSHADAAVAAAIEIAEEVQHRYRGVVRIGIGVNSGSVVAGTIGGGGRLDFTVIGDPVNTASRVERATREIGDPVLVTGATVQRLARDHGGFEERPPVGLRGKVEAVRLFAPRALAALHERGRGDGAAPLVDTPSTVPAPGPPAPAG